MKIVWNKVGENLIISDRFVTLLRNLLGKSRVGTGGAGLVRPDLTWKRELSQLLAPRHHLRNYVVSGFSYVKNQNEKTWDLSNPTISWKSVEVSVWLSLDRFDNHKEALARYRTNEKRRRIEWLWGWASSVRPTIFCNFTPYLLELVTQELTWNSRKILSQNSFLKRTFALC